MDDYNGYHSIRNGDRSRGGVAIFVKKSINASLLPNFTVNMDYMETVFIEIKNWNKNTTIDCCYRRPDGDKNLFLNLGILFQ